MDCTVEPCNDTGLVNDAAATLRSWAATSLPLPLCRSATVPLRPFVTLWLDHRVHGGVPYVAQ